MNWLGVNCFQLRVPEGNEANIEKTLTWIITAMRRGLREDIKAWLTKARSCIYTGDWSAK